MKPSQATTALLSTIGILLAFGQVVSSTPALLDSGGALKVLQHHKAVCVARAFHMQWADNELDLMRAQMWESTYISDKKSNKNNEPLMWISVEDPYCAAAAA
ncbi:hypothetical protein BJ165DRAFT_1409607 [Panaeolus papilionaceus]|nr:hypothetical protein BJ165DRAFT_1409607 [Panaeolus papilionaceus]